MARSLLVVVLSILSYINLTIAQSTTTDSPSASTASASYNVFSAIASQHPGNNHGDPAGSVGGNTQGEQGQNAAGASGGSESSVNLSTGAQIGIIVSVALVVIIGVGSAVLFLVAKKRQWRIRESIRRSARRLTGRERSHLKPPVFPKGDKGMVRLDPPHKSKVPQLKVPMNREEMARKERAQDVEKGLGNRVEVHAASTEGFTKSTFEMDSPAATRQSSSWRKMFGGR